MSGTIYVARRDETYLADVAELPGCIARGATRAEAIANVRRAFRDYLSLLEQRGVSTEHWKDLDPDTFEVKEQEAGRVLPDDERHPIEEHELRDFLHRMEASRSALLALVRGLSPQDLERKPSGTTWSVRETLEHIAHTEVSLLARLEKWPGTDFATLQAVHRMAFQRFTAMEPEDWVDHEVFGKRWTTRRVMRRILEHEFEHYQHIKDLIAALAPS